MIKSPDNPIILLECDGERRLFDPVDLQDTLVRNFLAAGLRENCYLAEDIALAVEYAFDHSGRPGKVFSRSELDAAVVRILGDTGLADVAALYQRGARSELSVDCRPDPATVGTVLRKFMAGSENHLDFLTQKVVESCGLLKVKEAAPSLLVELARHYERFSPALTVTAAAVGGPVDEFNFVAPEEIIPVLSPETRHLVNLGILRVHGVSRMFPSVRLFGFLQRFAEARGIGAPVTEMTLEPYLYEMGRHLENCRAVTLQMYREVTGQTQGQLPVYLALPDMNEFSERYLEANLAKAGRLEREIAQMVADALSVKAEKINLGA